jgi:hypothetical protein
VLSPGSADGFGFSLAAVEEVELAEPVDELLELADVSAPGVVGNPSSNCGSPGLVRAPAASIAKLVSFR